MLLTFSPTSYILILLIQICPRWLINLTVSWLMYWVKFAALPLQFLLSLSSLFFSIPHSTFSFLKQRYKRKVLQPRVPLCSLTGRFWETQTARFCYVYLLGGETQAAAGGATRTVGEWTDPAAGADVEWSFREKKGCLINNAHSPYHLLGEEEWGNMYSWVSQSQLELFLVDLGWTRILTLSLSL